MFGLVFIRLFMQDIQLQLGEDDIQLLQLVLANNIRYIIEEKGKKGTKDLF